jgi:HK97 gp10 family phage protein
MTVQWNGLRILSQVKSAVGESEKVSAKRIEKEAKRLCPVGDWESAAKSGQKSWKTRKPGRLRDAITAAKSKFKDGGWIVYVPAQGSDTYYVRWVELGAPARSKEQWKTSGHAHPVPRQPFLRPAFHNEAKNFKRRLKTKIYKKLI